MQRNIRLDSEALFAECSPWWSSGRGACPEPASVCGAPRRSDDWSRPSARSSAPPVPATGDSTSSQCDQRRPLAACQLRCQAQGPLEMLAPTTGRPLGLLTKLQPGQSSEEPLRPFASFQIFQSPLRLGKTSPMPQTLPPDDLFVLTTDSAAMSPPVFPSSKDASQPASLSSPRPSAVQAHSPFLIPEASKPHRRFNRKDTVHIQWC